MTATAYAEGRMIFDATTNSAVDKYLIRGVNWSGASNTDALVIDDQDDVAIFNAVANTGQLEINHSFNPPIPATQIKVSTIGGGTLIVYH